MIKAQAAMEYLITYGWAVLIMLIVIGALFYLGVFSPNNIITACTFRTPGFTCTAFKLTSNSGGFAGLILDLGQGTEHDIKVTGFNCTVNESWSVVDFNGAGANNITISSGSHKPIGLYAKSVWIASLILVIWPNLSASGSADNTGS